MAEDRGIGQRADRQFMLVIGPDGEAPVAFELELELARPQFLAILRAKHRREQLALLSGPVDVEPARISGLRPPFQNVEPQRIVGAPYAHMVGDDVENPPEPLAAKGFDHRRIVGLGPEFGIELIVIRDVIAVHAARPRLEDGRQIDMTDAKPRQVRRDRRGLAEPEAGAQLQPVGGAGNVHGPSIVHRTLQGPSVASASPQRQNGGSPTGGASISRAERLASSRRRRS